MMADGETDTRSRDTLIAAAKALVEFKRVFGRDLTPSLLAEVYVALELDLALAQRPNQPGFDVRAEDGTRYQIKQRDVATLNVDVNGFDFDYVVLVNLSDDYFPLGMWKLRGDKAKQLFRLREKFRKYQATQTAFKAVAEKVPLRLLPALLGLRDQEKS